jgi:hypothetical protein
MPVNAGEEELERLRARLAILERERFEASARANATIASAQEDGYWLERWGLDLDALLSGRSGRRIRVGARRVRELARRLRGLRGR